MTKNQDLAGVVLCGGQSQRMGRPKADLDFGTETLLQRVVRIAFQAVGQIIVVAAGDQEIVPLGSDVTIVRDPVAHGGPLVGIHAGLEAAAKANFGMAFVTSCDTPFLNPRLILHLAERLADHEVVVPKDQRFYYPLAAVYRTSLHARIQSLLEREERRPRALYSHCKTLELSTSTLQAIDPELRSLLNLNTPSDYRGALEMEGLPIPDWVDETNC